jgi:hypothetical protein
MGDQITTIVQITRLRGEKKRKKKKVTDVYGGSKLLHQLQRVDEA